jgi:hypothetical protein
MPKICYDDECCGRLRRNADRMAIVQKANEIIAAYRAQGFDLTLRQLYYQFVARDIIPNRDREYKRLGEIILDARMAGLIDWEAIVDRTRNLRVLPHWDEPSDIVRACAEQFRVDLWNTQPYRVEVWIEKDALVGVIEGVCNELDVPHFSCRGYTSVSEVWSAARRLQDYADRFGQTPVILHFGDHDPSGIDMSRDIQRRLEQFGLSLELRRLALNMDQVETYEPPPNPAKVTDSRYAGYMREFGEESWELDALEPAVLADLIRTEIEGLVDPAPWRKAAALQAKSRRLLSAVSRDWSEVAKFVEQKGGQA